MFQGMAFSFLLYYFWSCLSLFPLSFSIDMLYIILQHDFVKNAQPCSILQKMISEAKEIQEAQKTDEQDTIDDDEVT